MNIKSKISIFLIFIIFSFSAYAQKEKNIKYDKDSEIVVRTSNDIEKYKNDSDFDYDREITKSPITFMQYIGYWINKFFSILGDGRIISWIFYTILAVVLIFAIIKLFGIDYQTLFYKNRKVAGGVGIEVFDENIHIIDFNKIITTAIGEQNYRKAVRYLYLKLLKTLTDNEIIEWKINKTNRDYRREIRKSKYSKKFYKLTFTYEYTWYGEFDINKIQFDKIHIDFNNFYDKI